MRPEPDVLAVDGHVGGEGGGERGDPLGRRHLLDEELGAELRGPQLGHGAPELRRSRRRLDARLLGCRHADRLGRAPGPEHPTRRLTCEDRRMPAASTTNPALHDSAFLRAARGEPAPHTPVWFMRQAGRSLPEYLKVREGVTMLESCMRPELVVEITMQPVRRYGVDAAIFFSDIVLPLKAVGVDLDIVPGVGPVVADPVRTLADVEAIPDLTPEHVPFITEAVQGLVGELGSTPLIGFAGAPFTVASYLVEGGPSKEHARTKAMMFGAPDVWDALMRKISGIAAAYLEVQVEAGASAVQLFDSWAGAVTRERLRAPRACRTRRACSSGSARPVSRASTSGSAPARSST